jgi:hypothetical protein
MKNLTTRKRSRVRPRIPIAYASLLIIALLAVVGFAAFSPGDGSSDATATTVVADSVTSPTRVSARVAAAVLAVRVADSGTRTATTQGVESDEPSTADEDTATTSPVTTQSEPADTTPPSFKVSSPHDGDTIGSSIVEITGTVEKGASVRSGPFDATVNDDGTWSISLALAEGANGASLTATDAAGNTSSVRIVLHYSPPTTTTKAPAPKTTKAPAPTAKTSTPTKAPETTTTKATSTTTSSKWSANWPADAGGIRDVEKWRPIVAKYWAADRVDCVLGIIYRESKGDPRAYNSKYGASGLMQHLSKYWPGRAASAGFKDSNGLVASPYNGEANIAAGAAIAGSGTKWYSPWSRLPNYGTCSG